MPQMNTDSSFAAAVAIKRRSRYLCDFLPDLYLSALICVICGQKNNLLDKIRSGVVIILCLIFFQPSLAQESVTQETNAPGVKWYQVNTPNFRILYPKGFEDQAQRVANTMETIREPEAKTMGALPKKISIILQNNSSLSNGFVTLAPRRSEFYTMPSQNYNFVGTNDWLSMLSSHEYRHIVQFQRSITGFNKFFYYVFGQQAVAGLASRQHLNGSGKVTP